jgi:serine phosphatase RsbU (regulator of sigma subunit)
LNFFKHILLSAIFFFWTGFSFSQNKASDSPKDIVDILFEKANEFRKNNLDSAIYYHKKAAGIVNLKNGDFRLCKALSMTGWDYYLNGEYKQALDYYNRSYEISDSLLKTVSKNEDIKLLRGLQAGAVTNKGTVYMQQGNYPEALDCYLKSMKIYEAQKNKQGLSASFGNIAIIYTYQNEYSKALDYFKRATEIDRQMDNLPGVAENLTNMGSLYSTKHQYDTALIFFNGALEIVKELKDEFSMTNVYGNISQVYMNKQELDSAFKYCEITYSYAVKTGNLPYKANAVFNLATLYNLIKNYSKTEKLLKEAESYYSELRDWDLIKGVHDEYFKLYSQKGEYKKALESYLLYISYRDSIYNDENRQKQMQLDLQYSFDKKATADSVAYSSKEKVIKADLAKQEAELKVKRNQQYVLYGGIALLIVFGSIMYNRFKITNRQKHIIEEQKKIVEEKQQSILDSINYAKRIQEAILPSMSSMRQMLRDGFVMYLPKDVVAGDFYWLENVDNKIFVAAADCTGHGVPGALVSVVCSNALTKVVMEEGITETGKLLDRTREVVIEKFSKSGEEVKDGMDISLCAIDFNKLKMQWTGANNPLWIIRDNTLLEFKADKQPVGKFDNKKDFTTNSIDLVKGDLVFLFTDGFADQFGGKDGKKYKYKPFKEFLLRIQKSEMNNQRQLLVEEFQNWRGSNEQVDDVCVIGIRV